MKTRNRTLPGGWYPENPATVNMVIKEFMAEKVTVKKKVLAGIVPHAGWGYSGSLACHIISNLDPEHDTIVVVGGHLPVNGTVLAAYEDLFQTPLGTLEADQELLQAIKEDIGIKEDIYADNTVEIQLPMVKYFFPEAKILWMRAAPSLVAKNLGVALKKAADGLGRKVVVIGSTDLTHYGSSYGFAPAGRGEKAVRWVKEVNDKQFIDAALDLDLGKLLAAANNDCAACSAGGAACAIAFAGENGVQKGSLLEYRTSYDVHPGESFVGYAGIAYMK